MRPVFYAALTAILLAVPFTAHADDAAKAPVSAPLDKKARMESLSKDNPEAAKLVTMAQDLYNSLPKAEAERVVTVRTAFGMIRASEMAKEEVGKSTKLCADKNPSLKKDLDAKYQTFQNTVMSEIDKQEKNLDAALTRPNFMKPEPVKAFLDQLNKISLEARAKQDKEMVRVTTPEACAALGDSMDKNGSTIVGALQKITWPALVKAQSTPTSTPAPAASPAAPAKP